MEQQHLLELIKQTQEKDTSAFSEIYELYYEKLYLYTYRKIRKQQTSEDIVSNVFFKVLEKINQFKVEPGSNFNAWIFKITINEINLYYRNQKKYAFIPDETIAHFMVDSNEETQTEKIHREMTNEQQGNVIIEAMEKLKPIYQDIIHFRYFEELGFDEIAEILKTKAETIRVYLHRALKQLKSLLAGNPDFELAFA